MLYLVTKENYTLFRQELAKMFQLRYEVFLDELNRGFNAPLGHEVDAYDTQYTAYIIYVDHFGRTLGAVRLNATSRPFQLQQLCPDLESQIQVKMSPYIWEASRLSIVKECRGKNALHIFKSLMTGLVEFSVQNNIEKLIFLTEPSKEILYRRIGFVVNWTSGEYKIHDLNWRIGITHPTPALLQNMLLKTHLTLPLLQKEKLSDQPLHHLSQNNA